MKSIVVGLLAVFALTGCGVGVDDPEGEQAATAQTGSALREAAGPDPGQTTTRRVTLQVEHVALPQDPIPIHKGESTPPK